MFTRTWILGIVALVLEEPTPSVCSDKFDLTCEEFERGAYFNPYQIVDSMWKIIYFWGQNTELFPIVFSLPAKKRIDRFKDVVDSIHPDMRPEWHKVSFIMEPRPGVQVLFMYAGTPGAFRALVKVEDRKTVRPMPPPLVKLADVRMKMDARGRYMGMMCCEDNTAFTLARMDDMPPTEKQCRDAAITLGFPETGGRSYINVTNMILHDEL